MSTNLIQRLNELHGKSPDEIADILSDPLRMFVKLEHVTEGLLERVDFKTRESAYFYYHRRPPTWNNDSSAQDTPARVGTRTTLNEFHSRRGWALIGYEYRLTVDPFKIDWKTYEYIPCP